MGVSGLDLILSPAARKIMDLAIEAKNVEKLAVVSVFNAHYNKYQTGSCSNSLKLLIHKRNRQRPLVTMDFEDFIKLYKELLAYRHHSIKTKTVFDSQNTVKECSIPPAGWRCTREPGHDGPCAAIPTTDRCPQCGSPNRDTRLEVFSDSSLYDYRDCGDQWHNTPDVEAAVGTRQ